MREHRAGLFHSLDGYGILFQRVVEPTSRAREGGQVATATKTKPKIDGMLITADGRWRCTGCGRVTDTTPVCAGAHDDGSPRCGKAVCANCAPRCVRCTAPLCADDFARSKRGALCVQCLPPAEGRQAYTFRMRNQAAGRNAAPGSNDASRAHRTTGEAHESVDAAMRRADEIERQIEEMKKRMRRPPGP